MEPALAMRDGTATGAQKKRNAYSSHDKLKAITLLEETGNIRRIIAHMYPDLAAACYDIRQKHILGWRSRKKQIEEKCSSRSRGKRQKMRPTGAVTALSPAAEHQLIARVNELRKEGVPVSSLMLQLEVVGVAAEHGVAGFSASWSWRQRFMARYKLSLRTRTRQGQKTPDQLEQTSLEFAKLVADTVQELGVPVVHNAV